MAAASSPCVINTVLPDFILEREGETVFFECQVNKNSASDTASHDISCLWYKDNVRIEPVADKCEIFCNGLWYVLKIKSVTVRDQGTYCFVVRSNIYDIYSKCKLYVNVEFRNNKTLYFAKPLQERVWVDCPLRSCNIQKGAPLCLTAKFSTKISEYKWFKNDIEIYSKSFRLRTFYDVHGKSTTCLYVARARPTDSGNYSVVAKTCKNAYLCSFADVYVGADYSSFLYNSVTMPFIYGPRRQHLSVYNNDEVMLLWKATFDNNTIIMWSKDGYPIPYSNKIICETYDNKYISLKLFDVRTTDTGLYTLQLEHRNYPIESRSSTGLTVTAHNQNTPSACTVTKKLRSSISCIGDSVTLHCSFDIEETKYVYVQWIVGHYTVERSDERFKVIYDGCDYILHIPYVLPGMAGTVICQLRQFYREPKSILLCSSHACLTVVPPSVIERATGNKAFIKINNVHNTNAAMVYTSRQNPSSQYVSHRDPVMIILFSSLSNDTVLFDVSNERGLPKVEKVFVHKKGTDTRTPCRQGSDWRIEWVRERQHEFYGIDLAQSDGTYKKIGFSAKALFDIKEPPDDKLFKFRIKAIKPTRRLRNSSVCFVPAETCLQRPISCKQICTILGHKKNNGPRYGQGSFALVSTIRPRADRMSIRGIKRLIKQNMWYNVDRDVIILKNLKHAKTIDLIEAFGKKRLCGLLILTEYIWGMELIERIRFNYMSETDVIIYVRQILQALDYIDSKNATYLDVTPDNIICIHPNSKIIKLVNFGLKKFVPGAIDFPTTEYAAREYVPPELLCGNLLGHHSDMWSLGVFTYLLLSRTMPFGGDTWVERRHKISNANYNFDPPIFNVISARAKAFLNGLLVRCPRNRFTTQMALNDDWITLGPNKSISGPIQMTATQNASCAFYKAKWRVIITVARAIAGWSARYRPGPSSATY